MVKFGLEEWSWIAAIVAVPLSIMGLYYAKRSIGEKQSKSESVAQTSGDGSTQIGMVRGNVTINNTERYVVNDQVSECVDIVGRWNIATAKQIAMRHIETKSWTGFFHQLTDPLQHDFVGEYSLVYKSREGIVLIFSTKVSGDECHACAPYLSFFEFEKRDEGWKLLAVDVGAYQAGSWGKAPTLEVSVIAEDKYAVFMEDGYMAQGWGITCTSIHIRIGDKFKEVLLLITSQSNPDGQGWSSKVTTYPTAAGLYEIGVHRKGDNLTFMEGNPVLMADVAEFDNRVRDFDRFRFDGQRYKRIAPF